MSQPSNESQLLRGAFVPTLVVSLLAIVTSTVPPQHVFTRFWIDSISSTNDDKLAVCL
jgi:hypothetical protein